MNDRAVSLLEQYDLEVKGTRKGRDAILCDSDQGTFLFKEYRGNLSHLKIQDRLLKTIVAKGMTEVERLLPTKEGELFVKDGDGIPYVLKTYVEGRECNVKDPEECMTAVRLLAKLHLCTQDGLLPEEAKDHGTEGDQEEEKGQCAESGQEEEKGQNVAAEYEKRNRELRRIKKFLLGRSQKTWFEIKLLGCFDGFYEQAKEAQEGWGAYREAAETELGKAYCHGDYQYHNIICDQRKWYLMGFERCVCDNPVRDLHLLLRKLMEKTNWSIPLGERLIREYEKIRPLSAVSWIDLYYRLAYPEKFWKIANFYYNSGKAWIPEKNMEKLEKLLMREKEKKEFLETIFRI